jgi:signal transduction histidine kinase
MLPLRYLKLKVVHLKGDTTTSIPPSSLQPITIERNSGLGLSIALEIVKEMKGKINVSNNVGVGSIFTVLYQ